MDHHQQPSSKPMDIKLERCRQCKEVYTAQHELLKTSLFSDIDIYANDSNKASFRAHKYILATGSIVLKDYLTMYPHTSSLNLKSFIKHDPFNVALEVVEYLYSRHIVVNVNNILAIIRVAKQLRIDDLLQLSQAVLYRVCAADPTSMLPMCIQFNYTHDQNLLTYLVDTMHTRIEQNDQLCVQALAHFSPKEFETCVLQGKISMHSKFYCLQVYVLLNSNVSQWTSSSFRTCLVHLTQRAQVTDPADDLCTCARLSTPCSQDQCARLWSLIDFNALSPDLLQQAFRIPNIPQHLVFDAVMAKLVNNQQQPNDSTNQQHHQQLDPSNLSVFEKQMLVESTLSRLDSQQQQQQQKVSSSKQVSPVNSMHGSRPMGSTQVITPPFARAAYSHNASTVDLHQQQYTQQPPAFVGTITRPQSVPPILTNSPEQDSEQQQRADPQQQQNSEHQQHSEHQQRTDSQQHSEHQQRTNPQQQAVEPAKASLQLQTIVRTQMTPSLSNIVAEYASPLANPAFFTPPTTGDLFANYSGQPSEPAVSNHIWTVPDTTSAQPSMYVQQEYIVSDSPGVKVLGPVHELTVQKHVSAPLPPHKSVSSSTSLSAVSNPDSQAPVHPKHAPSPLPRKSGPSIRDSPRSKQGPTKRVPNDKSSRYGQEQGLTHTSGVVVASKKKKGVMAGLSSLVR